MRVAFLVLSATLLTACGQPDPIDEDADTDALPVLNDTGASPAGAPPADAPPAASARAGAAAVPAALRGRWGLTPRDCTAPLGEALGLLVIDARELRFFESRAVPVDVQTGPGSISGDFLFTGEAQRWTSHVTLELRNGELVRTERDPVVSFRYVRC